MRKALVFQLLDQIPLGGWRDTHILLPLSWPPAPSSLLCRYRHHARPDRGCSRHHSSCLTSRLYERGMNVTYAFAAIAARSFISIHPKTNCSISRPTICPQKRTHGKAIRPRKTHSSLAAKPNSAHTNGYKAGDTFSPWENIPAYACNIRLTWQEALYHMPA